MTKEQANEYLKKAAEHVKHLRDMRKIEYEGKQVFCVGPSNNEVHIYDNHVFIDMARALEKPFSINPDWSEDKGYCKFYTSIDGWEREWEIFTLYYKNEGWPNDK